MFQFSRSLRLNTRVRGFCFVLYTTATDAPRKRNQPQERHHQTERPKAGAHKHLGLAYSFFMFFPLWNFRPRLARLYTCTSFYRSLGHPKWVCDSYRLNGPLRALQALVGLTSRRALYADLEYFGPSSPQHHIIKIYIYKRVMPNTHLHKILISVQTTGKGILGAEPSGIKLKRPILIREF